MKIFLDDRRTPLLNEGFKVAKNYSDFVSLVSSNSDCLECVDLDYDLGEDSLFSGYHALTFLKEKNIRCEKINIHSTHESGRDIMLKYAKINFPDSEVTGVE